MSVASGLTDPHVGFDTFSHSLLTIFQVFTTSNWHELMYRAQESSGILASLFFISYPYFITTVVRENIVKDFFKLRIEKHLTRVADGLCWL